MRKFFFLFISGILVLITGFLINSFFSLSQTFSPGEGEVVSLPEQMEFKVERFSESYCEFETREKSKPVKEDTLWVGKSIRINIYGDLISFDSSYTELIALLEDKESRKKMITSRVPLAHGETAILINKIDHETGTGMFGIRDKDGKTRDVEVKPAEMVADFTLRELISNENIYLSYRTRPGQPLIYLSFILMILGGMPILVYHFFSRSNS